MSDCEGPLVKYSLFPFSSPLGVSSSLCVVVPVLWLWLWCVVVPPLPRPFGASPSSPHTPRGEDTPTQTRETRGVREAGCGVKEKGQRARDPSIRRQCVLAPLQMAVFPPCEFSIPPFDFIWHSTGVPICSLSLSG